MDEFKRTSNVKIKYKNTKKNKHKTKDLTGEDIDMFNERKYEENDKKKSICDIHQDGA